MSKSKQTTFQFILLGTVYIAANRNVSARVPLTATYVSTNAQIRQWLKVESESNHLYECCGYEANFLATLEQRASWDCHLY